MKSCACRPVGTRSRSGYPTGTAIQRNQHPIALSQWRRQVSADGLRTYIGDEIASHTAVIGELNSSWSGSRRHRINLQGGKHPRSARIPRRIRIFTSSDKDKGRTAGDTAVWCECGNKHLGVAGGRQRTQGSPGHRNSGGTESHRRFRECERDQRWRHTIYRRHIAGDSDCRG